MLGLLIALYCVIALVSCVLLIKRAKKNGYGYIDFEDLSFFVSIGVLWPCAAMLWILSKMADLILYWVNK